MRTNQEVNSEIDEQVVPPKKVVRPRNRYFGSLNYVPPLLMSHKALTLREVQDCFRTRIKLPVWASDNVFDGE